MADGKVKKNYKVEIREGRAELRMLTPDADGIMRSASCPYPFYQWEEKEHKDADGNAYTTKEFVRKSKQFVEKMLLQNLGFNA